MNSIQLHTKGCKRPNVGKNGVKVIELHSRKSDINLHVQSIANYLGIMRLSSSLKMVITPQNVGHQIAIFLSRLGYTFAW